MVKVPLIFIHVNVLCRHLIIFRVNDLPYWLKNLNIHFFYDPLKRNP